MRVAAALVLLVLGCQRGVPAAVTATTPARQSRTVEVDLLLVRKKVDMLRAALAEAAVRCTETCCFNNLPEWEPLTPRAIEATDASSLAVALRRQLESEAAPTVQALSMLWLSRLKDTRDVPRFESFLADTRQVWSIPQYSPSQAFRSCERITGWTPLSVGDTAREALGTAIGRHFGTAAEYRQWRQGHADIEGSAEYWDERLPASTSDEGCLEKSDDAARRDPRLLLALAIRRRHNHDDASLTCPPPSRVRSAFQNPSLRKGPNFIDLLRYPEQWLTQDSEEWTQVAAWVLRHARELLDRDDADAVEGMVTLPQFSGHDGLKGLALVAAGRLDVGRRGRVLRTALDQLRSPPPDFYTLYAASLSQERIILEWLRPEPDDQCAFESRSRAVLAGLAEAGPKSKSVLAQHLADPECKLPERPVLVGLLADTVIALGAPAKDFACREGLRRRGCLKTSREVAEANAALVAQNLPLCLSSIRRWVSR
jgi:hypothetical protein